MFKANGNFSLLKGSFVFAEAANRVAAFKSKNPDAEVIRMGIGDVTQPIVPAVVAAMHKAVDELGAEAIFTPEGKEQIKGVIDYYMENARIMTTSLKDAGYEVYGGKSAPYIWLKCGKDSWEFFDELLEQKQIVGTPGVGFGSAGEGYFRMTAFASRENTIRAMERVCKG